MYHNPFYLEGIWYCQLLQALHLEMPGVSFQQQWWPAKYCLLFIILKML
jgi:hypothetical protein